MNEKTTCTNENKVGNITSKVTYEIEHKNNDVKSNLPMTIVMIILMV